MALGQESASWGRSFAGKNQNKKIPCDIVLLKVLSSKVYEGLRLGSFDPYW
jgi:hypothetical protein